MTFTSLIKTAALSLMIALPIAGAASASGPHTSDGRYIGGNAAGGAGATYSNDMAASQWGTWPTSIAAQIDLYNSWEATYRNDPIFCTGFNSQTPSTESDSETAFTQK